jgi:hypothetical protein
MGTRNRERRQAKRRARERHRRERVGAQRQGGPVGAFASPSVFEVAEALVVDAVVALGRGDTEDFERCLKLLAEGLRSPDGHRVVGRAAVGCLLRDVGQAWVRGWQPVDLTRLVGRRLGSRHARMAADLIAGQLRGYAPATVDERWDGQLRALGGTVWWDRDDGYLDDWARLEGLDRAAAVRCALEVLYVLDTLPEIPRLCPPPGTARRGSLGAGRLRAGTVDQGALNRVRALLAKAESTEFPEEAEALTVKAQELMARHSIDYALLAAQAGGRDEPCGVRVGIDNPYEAAKALLLQEVAGANRCRTVWSRELGFTTVLGYPTDVDSVELLYTSLLVQATAAMVHAGSRRDAAGRSRTRSFRQSFLNAYAVRIGQRLRAATDEASRAAGAAAGDDRLLPVLAARDDAVRVTVERLFPEFVNRQVMINNRDGWASGTAAADRASLHARRAVGTS